MLSDRDIEQVESWAADFAASFAASTVLEGASLEHAEGIAREFLLAACRQGQTGPDGVTPQGVRDALLERMPDLALPLEAREAVPEAVATLLEWLEDTGKLAGGREGAQSVRAMAPSYRQRLAPGGGARRPPLRKAASKIGRNDPCPCGSGKKYKRCCGG